MTLTTQDQKGRGQDLGFEANKFLVLNRTGKTQIESKRNNFKTLAIRSSSLNWRKGRVPCLSVNQGPERNLVTFDPKGRTHSNPLHLRRNNGGKELEERGNRRFRNKPWHGKEQRREGKGEKTPPNHYLSWFQRNLVAKRNEVPNHVPRQGASPR